MSVPRIASLPITDLNASHRIVGKMKLDGGEASGIMGYYTRFDVGTALTQFFQIDPEAQLRVEPHNPDIMGNALRSSDVEWIVNDKGELGVKIGDQFFFLYKGESFMYSDPDSSDTPKKYRLVGKREFGETTLSPFYKRAADDPEFLRHEGLQWVELDHKYNRNETAFIS